MKWVYRFFVVLGVIFFCILLALGYFIVTDPFNLRPIIMNMYATQKESSSADRDTVDESVSNRENTKEAPAAMVSDEQKAALESVGISPTAVPAQFTAEQIQCFIAILGEERVNAIKAGDTPTPVEFYQAKDCI